MKDSLVEDICAGKIKEEDLTAKFIRDNYKLNIYDNPKRKLGGGRSILEDIDQLDQYLYTYSLMAQKQWDKAFDLRVLPKEATLIDYGCGQGLSLLNFLQQWSDAGSFDVKWKDRVKKVKLIEPSSVALDRAQAVAGLKFPHSTIKAVNKKLENLDDDDLAFEPNKTYIHIFSQVLDITMSRKFSITELFEKITSAIGTHYILIVGHKVDYHADSVLELYQHVSNKYILFEERFQFARRDCIPTQKNVIRRKVKNITLNNFVIKDSAGQNYDSNSLFVQLDTFEKTIYEYD